MERFYDGKAFIASVDGMDDDDAQLGGDAEGEYLAEPQWVAMHIKAYLDNNSHASAAPGLKRPTWYKLDIFDEERQHYGARGLL